MVTDEILSMEVDQNGVIHYDMVGRPPPTNEALSWMPGPTAGVAAPQGMMPFASHVQQHGVAPVHIQINNAPR